MLRLFVRTLTLTAALMSTNLGFARSAVAHPHVRISVEATFVVERGAVTAIKHRWTFDEDYRRSSFLDFDVDKNGVLDASELAAFRELSLETLRSFDSFTVVWRDGVKVKLQEPVLVRFDLQAAKPIYEFEVALSTPVPLMGAGASIEVYDPTYYSAFDFNSDRALSIEVTDGTSCAATSGPPARQSQQMKDYRAYVAAFGPLSARLVTPRSIKLTCQNVEVSPGKASVDQ
jgi:ABC-type uncharacterized transport system substrate-binding protein